MSWIFSMLLGLLTKYPAFAAFLSSVGILHIALVPVMDLVKLVLEWREGKDKGDADFQKVEGSSAYQIFSYLVEILSGIKLK